MNDIACAKLGYSREELLRMSPFDISVPEDFTEIGKIFKKLLQQEHSSYERSFLTKSGLKIPVEVNAGRIQYDGRSADLVIIRQGRLRRKGEDAVARRDAIFKIVRDTAERDAVMETGGGGDDGRVEPA